ncbi:Imm41 family immunity protein [Actinobacillus suis]|uniref:Uncharacterized protein n=2 Tax=Actinobacillus suis TaxID=716 RepID=K0G5R9_ACTSU|nr:Imm41 family immunity protein [Actinobacillus suis]AFU19463.1 hypothetical protein ASU2_06625 [Actinobacillus suis H91-0380]AIJ31602.1 hypothetical protein ASU1_06695 [Actinobacillus suis ATCC 33415]MCO4166430.1 immunity 41 family protein [Actinobacillus suis]MCO4168691.1 immunity 41 family protein [Actinobacillus suis]MCQ9630849.1 immunity 41 family protein [Actinobacillus suis]
MDDLNDFYRNITFFKEYDGNSFIGRWLDYSEWNDFEYFKLEKSLLNIARMYSEKGELEQDILIGVMRIIELMMVSNWGRFEINDLDIYARYERFKYVLARLFFKEDIFLDEFDCQPKIKK